MFIISIISNNLIIVNELIMDLHTHPPYLEGFESNK